MKIKRNETYGQFVKRIRQTANLTQEDFATATGLGVNSVCQWEKGRYEPNFISRRAIDEFARKIK
jgi:DNA-binding transcriptional regulator YiaG